MSLSPFEAAAGRLTRLWFMTRYIGMVRISSFLAMHLNPNGMGTLSR